MIINFFSGHRQKTGWLLLMTFYAEIFGSAMAQQSLEFNYYPGIYIRSAKISHTEKFGQNIYDNEDESNVLAENNLAMVNKQPSSAKKNPHQSPDANIGGPGQPEMQAFQSVNANNMVDLFSGDFSYNIPLMDVGGYPLGISYRSGVTMDQEASWVGLGWNVNPGTIMRNVRGLPDDFNGTEKITRQYNIRKNWTAGITANIKPEVFGVDIPKITSSLGIFYNNYNGIGFELGAGATFNLGSKSVNGVKTMDKDDAKFDTSWSSKYSPSLSFTLNSQQGLSGSAGISMRSAMEDNRTRGEGSISLGYNSRSGLQDLQMDAQSFKYRVSDRNLSGGTTISFAKTTYTPAITIPFTNYGYSLTLKAGGELFGFHPLGSLKGYYSQQFIGTDDKSLSLPAYGYMHYQKGNQDESGLLDFNREKEIPYRSQTPHAAIPIYTYDVYTMTGEGISGSFRPYRGDVGYVRDHNIKTKNGSGGLGIDLGAGNLAHFGADLNFNFSTVSNSAWQDGNFIEKKLKFTESDSDYEAVYFRNPSEQTSNPQEFYDKLGGDDVVRVGIAGSKSAAYATNQLKKFSAQKPTGIVNLTSPIHKDKRDKRSQVISYLSAAEAQKIGLDTFIRSYPVNTYPKGKCDSNFEKITRNDGITGVRKPNHISEITVLNTDGKRYVYGIPAYNIIQKEVTFSVDRNSDGSNSTGLVTYYPGMDNTTANDKGKDNYFSSELTPGYAHSLLLTGLLSPDYVDITGDGITEDDKGDAVKFNYTRMKWGGNTNYKWRSPYDYSKASFNQGLKTDKNDDKGSYVYGEKEIWYLNSIESKTMIATMVLDVADRQDGFGAIDENGGRNSSQGLKRLKEISLYTKSDFYKNPAKAKPVKTVHFAYSYTLTAGMPSANGAGKLTLDSLWFTYNGNNRSARNKYRFTYSANNPAYNNKSYDRWGNYKPQSDNPNNVTNAEYPYATQDKIKADNNINAWNITQVQLPSSAKISVTYESDDYAYVQNKRAMNMFKIAGMGQTNVFSGATTNLYDNSSLFNTKDNQFIFIKVPLPVANKKDILQKYFEGVSKLYFRMGVKMPGTTGYEMVPFYAEFDSVGVVTGNPNIIWVSLKSFGKSQASPAIAAIQFLRLNLPGKAYPGSDVSDQSGARGAIQALLGMGAQFATAVVGFGRSMRMKGICKMFDTTISYVRLNNPGYNKFGGGLRVKKIVISDNWTNMTSGQKESFYGQEYDYTTTKEIIYDSSNITKSKQIKISSGVASYEPAVGNEENPFRLPIEYQESVSLAPTDYLYSEYPYCESLFPSAAVGYGKVTVSSINKRNLKSFNGWEETAFYTTADFPTVTDYTTFDNESRKRYKSSYSLISSYSKKRTTLSQGFKIELNDMNGKLKWQKSYAANDSVRPISYTINYYKTARDNVHGTYLTNTVAIADSANGKINPAGIIGKDMELMVDFREQQVLSTGVAVNLNTETMVFGLFPIAIPAFFPVMSVDDNKFRSAVAVKVIQRYGILDSILHYEKGNLVSTRNMLFDAQTGDVLLTSTQNEFNDPVYNFNYPAHWAYSGLEPACRNISAIFNNIDIAAGKFVDYGNYALLDRYFESGDELLVTMPGDTAYNSGGYCHLGRDSYKAAAATHLWVVNINKTTNASGKNLFIIDRFGNPFTNYNTSIKIVRSGKRNMAATTIGSITSLREPIDKSNPSQWLLKFDSTTGVIATSAGVFKDFWNVDNRFVSEYKCDTTTKQDSLPAAPRDLSALQKYASLGTGEQLVNNISLYPDWLTAAYEYQHHTGNCAGYKHSVQYITRAILKYDLSGIPKNAVITNALLILNGIPPYRLWAHSSATNFNNCRNYWSSAVSVAHDYFDKNSYPNGSWDNAGFLKRITGNWDVTTSFNQLNAVITEVNKVSIPASKATNNSYTIQCSQLIQDCIKNPNYGLIMMQSNETNTTNTDQTRHLSFAIGGHTPPILKINYSYKSLYCRDTCVSIFLRRINPYVQGIWGNWRMNKSYIFYDDRKETDPAAATNIRRDGEFKKFVSFWAFGSSQVIQTNYSKWIWNAEMTRLNKRGLETENKDPLGRYNSGLYGYNQSLPVAVAQNARYRQIAFDGFEDYGYKIDSCDQRCPPSRHIDFGFYKNKLVDTTKHTGKSSLRLGNNESAILNIPVVSNVTDSLSGQLISKNSLGGCGQKLDSIVTDNNILTPLFSPLQKDTLVFGIWVKESQSCKCSSYVNNQVQIIYSGSSGQLGVPVFLRPSGNIIEGWQRYEQILNVPATAVSMQISLQNTGTTDVFFDDIRIHPFNSNLKTFVYNPVNLRLMAELDENNYASFYEYDDEGTLVRVKKETQKGIKTISETKSALTLK